MYSYKGHADWNTISGDSTYSSVDEIIENLCSEASAHGDIDILDINIRSTSTPETSSDIAREKHFVTIIYYKKKIKERVEI